MISADTNGRPSRATKQPARKRAATKAMPSAGKAKRAPSGKAQTAGARKAAQAKTGKNGDQAIIQETAEEAEEERETSKAGSKGSRPGRKGKQASADGQKPKAAPASKGAYRVQQHATRSKQEHSIAEEDEQSDASDHVPSSPVGVAKAQPKRRGRKALTDNGAEQDEDAAATAVGSPSGKAKGSVKAAVKAGQKAASKGKKRGSGGQKKEVKAKQPSRQQQPR